MKYPLESTLFYPVLALLVLAVFYGIYFTKMILQRRHGIHTHQIGRRKEKELHRVEQWMSVATLGIVIVQLASIIFGWNHMPSNGRFFTGFLLGLFGDLIFLISVIVMKDSWRAGIPDTDKTELVTGGIYRFSRNPAFLGFDLMYLGVLLMYFNGAALLFTLFAITMLHCQILQEEKFLAATFGQSYLEYKEQVCRYLGRKKKKEL